MSFSVIVTSQPLAGRLARKYGTGKNNVKILLLVRVGDLDHKSEKNSRNIKEVFILNKY